MKILDKFNYFGFNRRSEKTSIELLVALSEAELSYLREHAGELLIDVTSDLRAAGIDIQALTPLSDSFPESPREQFSFLVTGIALTLQRAAGHRVDFRMYLPDSEPEKLGLLFEYESSEVGFPAVELAIELITSRVPTFEKPEEWSQLTGGFHEQLLGFLENARKLVLPISTQAIIDAAVGLDIPAVKLDRDPYEGIKGEFRVCPNGMLKLGYGCHSRILDGTFCIERKDHAVLLKDRAKVNELIQGLGLPAPKRDAVSYISSSRGVRAANQLGYPVAVKTLNRGDQGFVVLNVRDETTLRLAIASVLSTSNGVVIERFVRGETTHILVVGFEVVESLTGGRSNVSAVHPSLLEAATATARHLNAGIMLMTVVSDDVSQPMAESGGVVVDLDIAPKLDTLVGISESIMAKAAEGLVRWLFPPGIPSRIPLVAITGTNGKTTTTSMITAIAKADGYKPGMASTIGVVINGETSGLSDKAGTRGHHLVLESDEIDFGVLETARGGITHSGFMFDHCNVASCGNVTEDHLGEFGINSVEEMSRVKRSVLQRATDAVIINADDPYCLQMLPINNGARLGLVSLFLDAVAARQVAGDENAIFAGLELQDDKEVIVIDDAGERIELMLVEDIPATRNGSIRYNIYNALHAILASHQAGLSPDAMRKALSGYDTSFHNLPGRLNIYDELPFRIIMNYMTSPDAVSRFCNYVRGLETEGRKIILFAGFGNKPDDMIRNTLLATIDAFDTWFLRDFVDLRGREPGEVPAFMQSVLLNARVPQSSIHVLQDGEQATEYTLKSAVAGDLVVIAPMASEIEKIWGKITTFEL